MRRKTSAKNALYSVQEEGWKKKKTIYISNCCFDNGALFFSQHGHEHVCHLLFTYRWSQPQRSHPTFTHSDVKRIKNAKTCRDIAYYKTTLGGFEGEFDLKTFFALIHFSLAAS